jgi:outer membrane protein
MRCLPLFAALLLWTNPGAAAEPQRLRLADFLLRVETEHALVRAAEAELTAYEAIYDRAMYAWLPVLKVESLLAPLPERRLLRECAYTAESVAPGVLRVGPCPGTDPDADERIGTASGMGVLTRTKATLTLPLYTFGKIDAGRAAARQGVEVGRHGVDAARTQLTLLVKRAYYGAQMTVSALSILDDARERLRKARNAIEKELAAESGRFTRNDVRKLDVQAAEVESGYLETQALSRVAWEGLRLAGGFSPDVPLALADEALEPVAVPVRTLEAWHEEALAHRPDLLMARAAVEARAAQLAQARAEFYPDLAVVGAFGYALGTSADKSPDPFADDDYNFLSWGVLLGAEWKLDPAARWGKLREAEAAWQKQRALLEAASQRARLEVMEAGLMLERYRGEVLARRRAVKASKGWLVSNTMNFGLGLATTDELIDSLTAYSKARLAHYRALFEYNLAAAGLASAVGAEVVTAGIGRLDEPEAGDDSP